MPSPGLTRGLSEVELPPPDSTLPPWPIVGDSPPITGGDKGAVAACEGSGLGNGGGAGLGAGGGAGAGAGIEDGFGGFTVLMGFGGFKGDVLASIDVDGNRALDDAGCSVFVTVVV